MRAHEFLTEAFNQPYPLTWNKSEHGDYDALARLPDGTNLSILFNNEGDEEWQVEFYRNNSLEVTGEGDAQRVFATVLSAIQQFIQKEQPWRIMFTASKDGEENSPSRSSLYSRMVQRYARAWGYDEYSEDHGDRVVYELTKDTGFIKESYEHFDSVVKDITTAIPESIEIWFHGSRARGKGRRKSDWDILVVVPDSFAGSQYLDTVRLLQQTSKKYPNFDIQPTMTGSYILRIAQEEGKLLWTNHESK